MWITGHPSSPSYSRPSPLSLLQGKPTCDHTHLTNLLPLPSPPPLTLPVPSLQGLGSAVTLLSLWEDRRLPSPPLSPCLVPPLTPQHSRSLCGVGVDSPPSGRMGVKCQGGLSGHQVVNGQTYTTRHTDYYVGTDQGPREPRGCHRTLTGLGEVL